MVKNRIAFCKVLPLTATVKYMNAAESIALKVGQGSLLPGSMNVGWSFER